MVRSRLPEIKNPFDPSPQTDMHTPRHHRDAQDGDKEQGKKAANSDYPSECDIFLHLATGAPRTIIFQQTSAFTDSNQVK